MELIVAIKKRYKYLLIKHIMTYHDTPEAVKEQLDSAASKMKWDAASCLRQADSFA